MRYIKYILTILFIFCLLSFSVINVLAVNAFSTESLSEHDAETFLNNVNISLLSKEPVKRSIDCFDVRKDKTIAVGCSNLHDNTIVVYNADNNFEYGYHFNCTGDFGLEWTNDRLNIYFLRSNVSVSVNDSGEIESVFKIQDTVENNTYWNNILSNRRKVDDTEYILKNDMGILNLFASSYSQLVAKNIDGEEMIIYDVNSSQLINTVVVIVMVSVFVGVVLIVVFYNLKNSCKIYRD